MENKCGNDIDQTIEYYEINASAFIESTIGADVSGLYKPLKIFLFLVVEYLIWVAGEEGTVIILRIKVMMLWPRILRLQCVRRQDRW